MKQTSIIRKEWLAALLIVMLSAALPAVAQDGLGVEKVFATYGKGKGCKMVEMHDATLRGHRLAVYKSLTYKNNGESIRTMLQSDRKRAKKIREVVEDGHVVSGYYMMPPLKEGVNRFILFAQPTAAKGVVIYIEGRLSPDEVMQLCYFKFK